MNEKELKEEYRRLVKKLKESGEDPTIKIRNEDIARTLGYNRSYFSQLLGDVVPVSETHIKDLLLNFPHLKESESYIEQRRNHKLNGEQKGIPIYEDAPYTLGNIESYRDTPTEKADFWVTIPGLRNCNYGIRATGDSMHPLIRNHALVVGEEITDTSFIPSGDIYIVRAKNGLETIKYIQPHDTDPKKFVLVPYNEKAKPTDILKRDILKIWKAKAVFNVL